MSSSSPPETEPPAPATLGLGNDHRRSSRRRVLLDVRPHDELVREIGVVVDQLLVHGRHCCEAGEDEASEHLLIHFFFKRGNSA